MRNIISGSAAFLRTTASGPTSSYSTLYSNYIWVVGGLNSDERMESTKTCVVKEISHHAQNLLTIPTLIVTIIGGIKICDLTAHCQWQLIITCINLRLVSKLSGIDQAHLWMQEISTSHIQVVSGSKQKKSPNKVHTQKRDWNTVMAAGWTHFS